MSALRVAQITDIHLLSTRYSKYYEVDTAVTLGKVIEKIKTLSVDVIVVSGDLAEDGAAETYQRLAEMFIPLEVPVYFLPGNHDDPSLMTKYLNGGSANQNNLHSGFSAEISGWGLLFLNSQVKGFSHGRIGADQLIKIDQYLTTNNDKPVFIAQHHPSFTVCPVAGCQLEDAVALQNVLEQHKNVKVVVAGHTHNDMQNIDSSYAQYVTPSSFACAVHQQDLAEHKADDFWAGHKLTPEHIGFRLLDLTEEGAINSEVIWV